MRRGDYDDDDLVFSFLGLVGFVMKLWKRKCKIDNRSRCN